MTLSTDRRSGLRAIVLACLLGVLAPVAGAQSPDATLKFMSQPGSTMVSIAKVANNGRLLTDHLGNTFVVHPTASIAWMAGGKARSSDLRPGMSAMVNTYDAKAVRPVIRDMLILGE